MALFSDSLHQLMEQVKALVTDALPAQNMQVLTEFTYRKADTPLVYDLVTIGLHDVITNLTSLSVPTDSAMPKGLEATVTLSVVFHIPESHGGSRAITLFGLAADRLLTSDSFACREITCDPISYDRNRRCLMMKTRAQFQFIV